MIIKNVAGLVSGRLTVISETEPRINSAGKFVRRVVCRCECGTEKEFDLYEITKRSKPTRSCGCLSAEQSSKRLKEYNSMPYTRKRNQSLLPEDERIVRRRLSHIWNDMKKRCYRRDCDSHSYYVDKGIAIVDEWKNSFENFYNWSLQNGYKIGLSIDRIDNNKDYSPDNCRWATKKQQANNIKTNVRISNTHGEIHTISEWIDIYSLGPNLHGKIWKRQHRHPNDTIEMLLSDIFKNRTYRSVKSVADSNDADVQHFKTLTAAAKFLTTIAPHKTDVLARNITKSIESNTVYCGYHWYYADNQTYDYPEEKENQKHATG